MFYIWDTYGRFSGTSETHVARSTPLPPPELLPDWNWNGFAWVNAPFILVSPIAAAPVAAPVLPPTQFKLCFTSEERIAIYAARADDETIDDALKLLDDPKTTEVDLGLASNQGLIDYLVGKGLVTEERAPDIKAGKIL